MKSKCKKKLIFLVHKRIVALTFKHVFICIVTKENVILTSRVIIAIKLCIVNKNEFVILSRAPQYKDSTEKTSRLVKNVII